MWRQRRKKKSNKTKNIFIDTGKEDIVEVVVVEAGKTSTVLIAVVYNKVMWSQSRNKNSRSKNKTRNVFKDRRGKMTQREAASTHTPTTPSTRPLTSINKTSNILKTDEERWPMERRPARTQPLHSLHALWHLPSSSGSHSSPVSQLTLACSPVTL